ncbi:type VI secretion protein [Acinetobacter sp. ANC 4558]|uniref:type VI secretion system baseplate subunit TssG n=1 Tax=Acinetobacter sp. ANC 4558 TaxID=1977876 RepID=UPI000A34C164|nr:type VI secretion system baseplate subunit TssG [Acinetobacter sp. ANC 4558]OTG86381.1 type VI secretion protein [Acinetobacter sp. ANC 4558]
MRAERWWKEASVIDDLSKHPQNYEFIQSVRLLRHSPYIQSKTKWDEGFLFESSFHLNFPLAEIEALEIEDSRISITNLISGLTGIQGALPYTYTNKVRLLSRKQKVEIKDFINLFNHKLVSQYVEASLSYNLPVLYEVNDDNHYLKFLHALNGYISEHHQEHDIDDYFAEFAGLMQGQNNNTHAVSTVLNCIFKPKIEIEEFVEEKFKLEESQQTQLGNGHSSLGMNTFCGTFVRQINGKIVLKIGPLTKQQYFDFLPMNKSSNKLKRILQQWCDPTLAIDISLVLDKSEIEACQLGSNATMGLAQGAFLLPKYKVDNDETRYTLIG